jgi:tetratricopeptide (TPR) repeat protein
MPPDEAYPKAKELVHRAFAIDDQLVEGHTILGGIHFAYDWNFSGAESELKKAIELNPGYADAHHLYGLLLSYLGHHEEAIREVILARDLDPLAPRVRANVGRILYYSRRYDEALAEVKKALDFEPNHAATYEYLGDLYREIGVYEESLADLRKGMALEDEPVFSILIAMTLARSGRTEESIKILNELNERSKREYISPGSVAAAYAALGENDRALDLLDEAYAERDYNMVRLKVSPAYDPLRSDPRFAALLKKIGLEE